MNECVDCRKPKAQQACSVCSGSVCKKCVQTLTKDTFSFLKTIPEILSHDFYCGGCFTQHVDPALEKYTETMEQAKSVFVFFTTQKNKLPVLRRSKNFVETLDCIDRDETILRLAFFATQEGFNALIETEVVVKKIRKGAYQTSSWYGKGVPAQVDVAKLERHLEG